MNFIYQGPKNEEISVNTLFCNANRSVSFLAQNEKMKIKTIWFYSRLWTLLMNIRWQTDGIYHDKFIRHTNMHFFCEWRRRQVLVYRFDESIASLFLKTITNAIVNRIDRGSNFLAHIFGCFIEFEPDACHSFCYIFISFFLETILIGIQLSGRPITTICMYGIKMIVLHAAIRSRNSVIKCMFVCNLIPS